MLNVWIALELTRLRIEQQERVWAFRRRRVAVRPGGVS